MSLTAAMLCCSDGTVDEAEIKSKGTRKKFFKEKFDFENFQETLKGIRTLIDFSSEPGKKDDETYSIYFQKAKWSPKEERIQIYSFFINSLYESKNVINCIKF